MITRPQIKAYFHVEVLDSEKVFLLAEDKSLVLEGRIYPLLAPMLSGQYTVTELVTLLSGRVSSPELFYALNQLETRGYIVEGDTKAPIAQAAFWHQIGLDAATALDRLHSTPVVVRSVGNASSAALLSSLEQMGVQCEDEGSLQVVVTDDYMHPAFDPINIEALATKQPWMPVRLVGSSIWVGPLFKPGQTGCWACLAERIQANRQLESYIIRKTGQAGPLPSVLGALPSTVATGAHLAAIEIVKWILQRDNLQITGQLLTLDAIALEMRAHVLVRRPQCPVCGDPEQYRHPRMIQLKEVKKTYISDGGHRSLLPEETFARYQHHISPITGVVSWLVDLTGGEGHGLVHIYTAGHNFAMIRDNLYWLRRNLRSSTGGKGMTDIQAKVSAMGEAIERYSGVYRGDEPLLRGSYRSIGPQAIHVRDCLGFSEAQYANRQEWNARTDIARFHRVFSPFDESQELDWSPLWSLNRSEFRYLPASYCYYGHPEDLAFYFCTADGNGGAAGNTIEEAILQGFLELVERDSTAIWWYNRIRRPGVDLTSFKLPYLHAIQDYYHQLQRDLWVIDLTTDLGIPTFAAVSRRTDQPAEDIILGLGTHLDPQIGLLRAITELNQFLPAVNNRAPDGSTIYDFPVGDAITWWKTATATSESYLLPDPNLAIKHAADYRNLASDDLMTDVQTCVAIANRAGLETFVLDQTRPDIGMSVCRVVVPGLRHFWRRLGPGRLYTVPVKLGWRDAPTAEDQMNPHSIFF